MYAQLVTTLLGMFSSLLPLPRDAQLPITLILETLNLLLLLPYGYSTFVLGTLNSLLPSS
jgi:hypothetical protein